jgi:5'-deoxynucleotidase YfbR-like HD superfamily hydrolase
MDFEESKSMKDLLDRIKFIHDGRDIIRFHQHGGHLIKPNSNAQHQWGVLMLCYLLTDGQPGVNLLMAAATHDLAEQAVGDVPAPTKRALGLVDELDAMESAVLDRYGFSFTLTEEEQQVLKLADALDGCLYCCREASLGNRNVKFIYEKWMRWLRDMPGARTTTQLEVMLAVRQIWRDSNDSQAPNFDIYAD